MKRKTARSRRPAAKKTARSTSRRETEHMLLLPFSFRRIILVSTCIVLFLLAFVVFNKPQVTKSVAGISVARGLFAQATIDLPKVEGATSYTVYYKKASAREFTNTVWGIPVSSVTYTLSYLKKGEAYQYKVAAVDAKGAEFSWSADKTFTASESM